MLSLVDIRRVVSEYTYYPGWTFEIIETQFESPIIRMVGPVEDSYHPGRMIDLGIDTHLPPMPDEQYLKDWLAWRLERIASHESREWTKHNGVVVHDPHATEEANEPSEESR